MQNFFAILSTLFIAFLLTLLPMPEWTIWFRPSWILMVLIFWTMVTPYRVNVGVAWLTGISLDVLNGTLFGEHAIAFVLVIYLVSKMNTRLRMFPLLQQGLCIFGLVLLYQFVLYSIQGFLGELPKNILYWSSSLTSMLLWPWVFIVMNDFRRRFRVN